MENKKILYVYPIEQESGMEITHRLIEDERPYQGLFYNILIRNEFPQFIMPGIGLEEIVAILKKYGNSLDLVVADGLLNNNLSLPFKIRTLTRDLTNAKILVAPIYGGSEEKDVAISGADFGIQLPEKADNIMKAYDNIFSGKIGGYIFNPDLYEERNGSLISKESTN